MFSDFGIYNKYKDKIIEANQKTWTNPQHRHYTNHGIEHSERILERLKEVLADKNVKISQEEQFILFAACYLHDVGMQCTHQQLLKKHAGIENLPDKNNYPFSYENLEKIRASHALSVSNILTI